MFPYQNTKIPNFTCKNKKNLFRKASIYFNAQLYRILVHIAYNKENREQRRKFISWLEINVRARNRGLQSGMELKGGGDPHRMWTESEIV